MDVSRPFAALSPGVDADVLVSLANARTPRSGRELARRTGRSNTGVQHVLDRLVDEGLVERMEAGRAFLYTLNYDHLLAAAVEQMAGARAEFVRRLREEISGWKIQALHGSLFGSAARGDGDAQSDIDLLVVRGDDVDPDDEAWRAQVERLAENVHRWTGNHAGIVELDQRELSARGREGSPVLREASADAIDLAGEPLRQLVGSV